MNREHMATNKDYSKLALVLKTVNPNVCHSAGLRLIDVPINYQSKFYDAQTIVSCIRNVWTVLTHNLFITDTAVMLTPTYDTKCYDGCSLDSKLWEKYDRQIRNDSVNENVTNMRVIKFVWSFISKILKTSLQLSFILFTCM